VLCRAAYGGIRGHQRRARGLWGGTAAAHSIVPYPTATHAAAMSAAREYWRSFRNAVDFACEKRDLSTGMR
jgi:hypothetical protein